MKEKEEGQEMGDEKSLPGPMSVNGLDTLPQLHWELVWGSLT